MAAAAVAWGPGSEVAARPAAYVGRHRRLVFGSLNVQSLWGKLLELSEVLHRQQYDVILLTETWLKPSMPNRLLVPPATLFTAWTVRAGGGTEGWLSSPGRTCQ